MTICHATGWKSHPFVVISPVSSGVFHGHMGHQVQEDVVPTFTFNGLTLSQNWSAQGHAMLKSGCTSASTETQPPTTTTTTTSNAAVITTQQTTQLNTQQSTPTSTPQSSTPQGSTPQDSTPQGSTPQGLDVHASGLDVHASGLAGIEHADDLSGRRQQRRPRRRRTDRQQQRPVAVRGRRRGHLELEARVRSVSGTLPFTGLPLWIGLASGSASWPLRGWRASPASTPR